MNYSGANVGFAAGVSLRRPTGVGRQLPTVDVGYPDAQLGVGFPAVRSLTLLSLADPERS